MNDEDVVDQPQHHITAEWRREDENSDAVYRSVVGHRPPDTQLSSFLPLAPKPAFLENSRSDEHGTYHWSVFPIHPAVDVLLENLAAKKLMKPEGADLLTWRQITIRKVIDILKKELHLPITINVHPENAHIEAKVFKHFRLVEIGIDFFIDKENSEDVLFLDMARLRGDALAYAYTVSRIHRRLSSKAQQCGEEADTDRIPRLENRAALDVDAFVCCIARAVDSGILSAGEEAGSYLALWIEEASLDEQDKLFTNPEALRAVEMLLGSRSDAVGILYPALASLDLVLGSGAPDGASLRRKIVRAFGDALIAMMARQVTLEGNDLICQTCAAVLKRATTDGLLTIKQKKVLSSVILPAAGEMVVAAGLSSTADLIQRLDVLRAA